MSTRQLHIAYGPTAPTATAWFDTITEARDFGAGLRAAGLRALAVVGRRVTFSAVGHNDSDATVSERSRAAMRAVETAERADAPTGVAFMLSRVSVAGEIVTGNGIEAADMYAAMVRAEGDRPVIRTEFGQEVSAGFAIRLASATSDELRRDYAEMSASYRFNRESGASKDNLSAMRKDLLTVARVLAYRIENRPAPAPGVRR